MQSEVKILSVIGIVSLVLILAGVLIFGSTSQPNTAAASSALLIKTTSHQTGSNDAKVNLVEFGDFQCPACGQAHAALAEVLPTYGSRVNFVYRHFPLPQHGNAMSAAIAAEAAGQQQQFFAMADLLYNNQAQWSTAVDPQSFYLDYANQLHLNLDQFKQDLTNPALKAAVENDKADGQALNIQHTPTFFINGMEYRGPLTVAGFKTALDKL